MKPKRIVRPKEAYNRLGCGKTKFSEDYEYHDGGKPNVPGTDIPRVKAIPLGLRNKGFLDNEIDDLIDALAALRDAEPSPLPKPPDAPRRRPRKHSAREGASP